MSRRSEQGPRDARTRFSPHPRPGTGTLLTAPIVAVAHESEYVTKHASTWFFDTDELISLSAAVRAEGAVHADTLVDRRGQRDARQRPASAASHLPERDCFILFLRPGDAGPGARASSYRPLRRLPETGVAQNLLRRRARPRPDEGRAIKEHAALPKEMRDPAPGVVRDMPTPSEDDRARALAALRQFQDEAGSLRDALRGYESALDRVCRRIETGESLHLVMEQIGVSRLRTDLVKGLTAFEAARHAMRIACFQMSLNEGLSIGDIARLWGISRQLVSRMLNEDVQRDPRSAEHSQNIGLEQLPPRLNEMIAPPTPSSRSTATR